jgi:hypothetical protein
MLRVWQHASEAWQNTVGLNSKLSRGHAGESLSHAPARGGTDTLKPGMGSDDIELMPLSNLPSRTSSQATLIGSAPNESAGKLKTKMQMTSIPAFRSKPIKNGDKEEVYIERDEQRRLRGAGEFAAKLEIIRNILKSSPQIANAKTLALQFETPPSLQSVKMDEPDAEYHRAVARYSGWY